MPTYIVWDETGYEVTIEAANGRAAAQAYVDDGDWAESGATVFHELWVTDGDGTTKYTITVEPPAPKCSEDEHHWREVSLRGKGGGVVVTERCRHCGVTLVTDTWATNPSNGVEGYTTSTYLPAEYA